MLTYGIYKTIVLLKFRTLSYFICRGLDAINSKEWTRSSIYMSSYQTVENLCNHSVPMISSLAVAEFAMRNITQNMVEIS